MTMPSSSKIHAAAGASKNRIFTSGCVRRVEAKTISNFNPACCKIFIPASTTLFNTLQSSLDRKAQDFDIFANDGGCAWR